MKSVFIDLEFCEVKNNKTGVGRFKNEVIEIGAVKLDENNHVIERFDSFVKPEYGTITPFITELTHITDKDVENARSYTEVMDSFMAWVGEDDITIYSWSDSDWRQLQKEGLVKKYENPRLEALYDNWIDYQMVFSKILGIDHVMKLSEAVEGAGIKFEGRAHSAIVDAENTASLFALTQDSNEFEKKAKAILDFLTPTPSLSTNLGSLFTAEMLRCVCA